MGVTPTRPIPHPSPIFDEIFDWISGDFEWTADNNNNNNFIG